MWPLTAGSGQQGWHVGVSLMEDAPSRTLKPTLDQSIVLTGGGGKLAMMVVYCDFGDLNKTRKVAARILSRDDYRC